MTLLPIWSSTEVIKSVMGPYCGQYFILFFPFVCPWLDSSFSEKRCMMPRHTLDPCYAHLELVMDT
jgi:hypothetical protein